MTGWTKSTTVQCLINAMRALGNSVKNLYIYRIKQA